MAPCVYGGWTESLKELRGVSGEQMWGLLCGEGSVPRDGQPTGSVRARGLAPWLMSDVKEKGSEFGRKWSCEEGTLVPRSPGLWMIPGGDCDHLTQSCVWSLHLPGSTAQSAHEGASVSSFIWKGWIHGHQSLCGQSSHRNPSEFRELVSQMPSELRTNVQPRGFLKGCVSATANQRRFFFFLMYKVCAQLVILCKHSLNAHWRCSRDGVCIYKYPDVPFWHLWVFLQHCQTTFSIDFAPRSSTFFSPRMSFIFQWNFLVCGISW